MFGMSSEKKVNIAEEEVRRKHVVRDEVGRPLGTN